MFKLIITQSKLVETSFSTIVVFKKVEYLHNLEEQI